VLVAQSGLPRAAVTENGTRATVFGGYSYLRNNSNGFSGWEGQGTFNFNRYPLSADRTSGGILPLFDANTATPAHQDWWYLDSIPNGHLLAAWIALEDIEEDAGRFYVIPQTHKTVLHESGMPHSVWLAIASGLRHMENPIGAGRPFQKG
jgi:phytanoyl-CoA dioxygenase PhyH